MTDTKPPRVRIVSRGGLASTTVYVDGVLLPGVVRATWAADASSSRTVATLDIVDVELDVATRDIRSRLHALDIVPAAAIDRLRRFAAEHGHERLDVDTIARVLSGDTVDDDQAPVDGEPVE